MTAPAGRVRRAECPPDVTAFAGDVGMGPVENETGTEMIERLLSHGVAAAKKHRYERGGGYHAPKQGYCEILRVSYMN